MSKRLSLVNQIKTVPVVHIQYLINKTTGFVKSLESSEYVSF